MLKDVTHGNETKAIVGLAIPMIVGNLFQQLYNIADSIIVGQFIGADALAAVGCCFAIMVFLTSLVIGLCMGASVLFSHCFGAKDMDSLTSSAYWGFWLIGGVALLLNVLSLLFVDDILRFMNIPPEILKMTKGYLVIVLYGMLFTFVYNYFCSLLRALGNTLIPLIFLILSAVINIVLDILFITAFDMGVHGAALATILAQGVCAVATALYCALRLPMLRPQKKHRTCHLALLKKLAAYSALTSLQQSIMNLGILLVQGLVNSYGVSVMAAFGAAVKIDSFAYMPVQDFGNAFSTFIAQNKGANKPHRIHAGIRASLVMITAFCIVISALVVLLAEPLMGIFVPASRTDVIQIGAQYLRIVAVFYCLIGYLFMLYGLYRGMGKAGVSVLLTVISLGLRVALAYALCYPFGQIGIWWSIPIGWLIADLVGLLLYQYKYQQISIAQ